MQNKIGGYIFVYISICMYSINFFQATRLKCSKTFIFGVMQHYSYYLYPKESAIVSLNVCRVSASCARLDFVILFINIMFSVCFFFVFYFIDLHTYAICIHLPFNFIANWLAIKMFRKSEYFF